MSVAEFEQSWMDGRAMRLDDAVADALGLELTPESERGRPYDLTARELDVLRLLAEGKSDKEIGEDLFISYRTVQSHVGHILSKIGVSSRSAATNIAIREGVARS